MFRIRAKVSSGGSSQQCQHDPYDSGDSPRQANILVAHVDKLYRKTIEFWDNLCGSWGASIVHFFHGRLNIHHCGLGAITNVICHLFQGWIRLDFRYRTSQVSCGNAPTASKEIQENGEALHGPSLYRYSGRGGIGFRLEKTMHTIKLLMCYSIYSVFDLCP